jgi:polyribonucleotide nucleotidyltransferase
LSDKNRIDTVEEVLNVGDKVQVEIKEIDQRGKLSLTPVLDKSDESSEA